MENFFNRQEFNFMKNLHQLKTSQVKSNKNSPKGEFLFDLKYLQINYKLEV